MPKLYEEFRYGKISTDAEDGVKFAGHQYRPSLPDDTTYWMPTPMHELSYLAGTLTKIPRECPLRKGWDESGWVS